MDFAIRARFVLGIIGFFVSLFVVKETLALKFDPVVYELRIEGLKYLNPSYLKTKVMPIGGIHLSQIVVPHDPFVKSYELKYIGHGVALLKINEREIAFVVYAQGEYFLTSDDGYFLMKISKEKLYEATGYKIFFDIDVLNFNDDRITNPLILKDIKSVFSYEKNLEDELLEVDVKKKTLYFIKGISLKVQSFDLDRPTQEIIFKLVEDSEIGSRYLEIGKNFVHLPNR